MHFDIDRCVPWYYVEQLKTLFYLKSTKKLENGINFFDQLVKIHHTHSCSLFILVLSIVHHICKVCKHENGSSLKVLANKTLFDWPLSC